jgi:hypothetical protein
MHWPSGDTRTEPARTRSVVNANLQPRLGSDVLVQPVDSGAPRQLTHCPADGQQIWRGAWSADGEEDCGGESAVANNIVMFRGLRAMSGAGPLRATDQSRELPAGQLFTLW